jgi:hypothetical protein
MKRTLLIVLGLLLLAGAGAGLYLYNKPFADLKTEAPAAVLDAKALYAAFEQDEASANALYLGKNVEVSGKVLSVTPTPDGGLVLVLDAEALMGGISCAFLPEEAPALAGLAEGSPLALRGMCDGFLTDVNLSRCVRIPMP